MTSAAAAIHHSQSDWDWLWGLLGGVGGIAAVITLLLTLPTYLSNLLAPFKITSAHYRMAADSSMTITITLKNRQRNDRSLTGLIIGQPPSWWYRLKPRWWVGLGGSKLFDIGVTDHDLGTIAPGDSRTFNSVPLTRENGTPKKGTLPSNARVLAYCGASRPYVKRPKKIDSLPSAASMPPPKDAAAPVKKGPEPPEAVTPGPPTS